MKKLLLIALLALSASCTKEVEIEKIVYKDKIIEVPIEVIQTIVETEYTDPTCGWYLREGYEASGWYTNDNYPIDTRIVFDGNDFVSLVELVGNNHEVTATFVLGGDYANSIPVNGWLCYITGYLDKN